VGDGRFVGREDDNHPNNLFLLAKNMKPSSGYRGELGSLSSSGTFLTKSDMSLFVKINLRTKIWKPRQRKSAEASRLLTQTEVVMGFFNFLLVQNRIDDFPLEFFVTSIAGMAKWGGKSYRLSF